MRLLRTYLVYLVLLAGMAAGPADAEMLVVVSSNAAAWPLGTKVDGHAALTLEEGQRLTLVAEDGRSMTIAGPYSAPPSPRGQSGETGLLDILSALFSGQAQGETVIGAFRGTSEPSEAWAWTIDDAVFASGTGVLCRDTQRPLLIARPEDPKQKTVVIERIGRGQQVKVALTDESATVPWPTAVVLEDRARYRITINSRQKPTDFALIDLPPGLPTDAHRAAWMAQHGCKVQARRLLALVY